MSHPTLSYLPADRLEALADGRELPISAQGAALSADISGFTALTELLARTMGERRGADELARLLNIVYEELIAQVESAGATIISFSGDAMLCWFAQDSGSAAFRCASAIQAAMAGIDLPPVEGAEKISLAVKCAIVCGQAYRLRLGDPAIQYLDTLAGPALLDLAALEQLARPGEIIIDRAIASLLPKQAIREWRQTGAPALDGALVAPAAETPALPHNRPRPEVPRELVKPWLLPAVWARLERSGDEFITELRPAVALFGRFAVPAEIAAAANDLNTYVCWVQAIVARYEGVVLQLTIGEKGSFFYAAIGAPIAHEDDAVRAVLVARELLNPPEWLAFGHDLALGVSCGIMRTGAYGSSSRRTYGVLGDHVNLAARLMQHARPGELLVSDDIRRMLDVGEWQPLDPITVKGKSAPVVIHRLTDLAARQEPSQMVQNHRLPLIGRAEELGQLTSLLDQAAQGRGQAISITGEAGVGKSRMVAAVLEHARRHRWQVAGGECQSYSTSTPYAVWQSIWQTLFAINPADPPATQARQLESAIGRIEPLWLRRLPLLGPLVNLDLPDNELTRSFDARLRNESREALLVDWLRAWMGVQAPGRSLLIVLEDSHWMDPRSLDLLVAISRAVKALPVALLIVGRAQERAQPMVRLAAQIDGLVEVALAPLGQADVGDLVVSKLAQFGHRLDPAALPALVERVIGRTQGNPFYIEELLAYLHTRGEDLLDPARWDEADLPTSLHSLILSRIDQLSADEQQVVKVASVIGRLFREAWLRGYYPALGGRPALAAALRQLEQAALTTLHSPEPELVYLFKHVITRDVAYESLAFTTRAALHERLADYLEAAGAADDPQLLYQIAHHYERSQNRAKTREYLRRAGEAAQAAYANEDAIGYYERLLPMLEHDPAEPDILINLAEVLMLTGDPQQAAGRYRLAIDRTRDGQPQRHAFALYKLAGAQSATGEYAEGITNAALALESARGSGDESTMAKALIQMAQLYFKVGSYPLSIYLLERALDLADTNNDAESLAFALGYYGEIKLAMGEPESSLASAERALAIYEARQDKRNIGITHNLIAKFLFLEGRAAESRDHVRRALEIAKSIGDRHSICKTTLNLGVLFNENGDKAQALDYYQQALDQARTLGDAYMQCMTLLNICVVMEPSDPAYIEVASEAVAIAEKLNNQELYIMALNTKADLLRVVKRYDEAYEYIRRGIDLCRKVKNILELCRSLLFYGKILRETGEHASAHGALREALTIAQTLKNKLAMCKSFLYVANLLELRTDPQFRDEAVQVLAALENDIASGELDIHAEDVRLYHGTVERLKGLCDPVAFPALWDQGRTLTVDQAVDLALAWQLPDQAAMPAA